MAMVEDTNSKLDVLISQVAELKAQVAYLSKDLEMIQKHHECIARLDANVKMQWYFIAGLMMAIVAMAFRVLVP